MSEGRLIVALKALLTIIVERVGQCAELMELVGILVDRRSTRRVERVDVRVLKHVAQFAHVVWTR